MTDKIQYILNHPLQVKDTDHLLIEEEKEKYPYFYPFYLLQAKSTANHQKEKYIEAIKKASIYATNRKILFDYLNFNETDLIIDSKQNHSIKKEDERIISKQTIEPINDVEAKNEENLITKNISSEKTYSELEIESISTKEISNSQESKLNVNHPFTEWLRINTKEEKENQTKNPEKKEEVEEKFKVIEAFLDKNPKIVPAKEFKPTIDIKQEQKENLSHLMTETLAKIYVEQRKFDKAIKAYRILRLKYPEKSGYFADCIKEINELKNN